MLWHIELKVCIWLYFTVLQWSISVNCNRSYAPFGTYNTGNTQFSPTCFDIFSWKFADDFILLYYRSSVSVVNLRQFLWELCPFWNLNFAWLYFTVLQIKFECCQFPSILMGTSILKVLLKQYKSPTGPNKLTFKYRSKGPTCKSGTWSVLCQFKFMQNELLSYKVIQKSFDNRSESMLNATKFCT